MAELIVGGFLLLFMFLVDWRLNRIYQELRTLNEMLRRRTASPG